MQITVIKAKNGYVVTSTFDNGNAGNIYVCPNLNNFPEVAKQAFQQQPVAVVQEPGDDDE